MRAMFVLCILALSATRSYAQDLAFFDITHWQNLVKKAKFFAHDSAGKQQYPTVADVSITEDGLPVNLISVVSPSPTPYKPLSTVLVFDIATVTVTDTGSIPNIRFAKAAAQTWINKIVPYESQCAISGFRRKYSLNQDFTFNKAKLLAATERLQSSSDRNIEEALISNRVSALQLTKNANYKSTIILLTDSYQPHLNTTEIIAEAKRQNCTIYTVTVGLPTSDSLQKISKETGGKWFDAITSIEQVQKAYREIYYHAQGHQPCEISWVGSAQCFTNQRTTSLQWNGKTATVSYYYGSSNILSNQKGLFFNSKLPGKKHDTTIKLTAKNINIAISQITSSNPAFDINPKQLTLYGAIGQNLVVSYTPTDSSYAWTQFTLHSDVCRYTYFASGGFPSVSLKQPTLSLTKPTDNILVAGSNTDVAWNGISPDDGITLEYSSDSGMAWNPIVRNAKGGKYLWRVPNIESNYCLLRARQALFGISQQPHQWPQRIGGPKSESVSGIVADNAGHIFIAGYSTGEITDFGSSALKTPGGYVAKYSTDGRRIWAVQFTGIPSDAGKGIAIDNAGNLVITGRFFNKMDIGDTSLTAVGGADIFVAKFDSDGNLQWATQAGGIDPDQSQAVTADKQGNIYITGSFFKRASFGEYELVNTLIERNDTTNYFRSYENAFVAKYSKDGKIIWVKKFDGISNTSRDAVYGGGISMDASGNLIVIGNFNGWIKYSVGHNIP